MSCVSAAAAAAPLRASRFRRGRVIGVAEREKLLDPTGDSERATDLTLAPVKPVFDYLKEGLR